MSPLPKSFNIKFTNFIQVTDDRDIPFSNHLIYSAISFADEKQYTILAFNHSSEIFEKSRDLAITLYLQEIFYLCTRFGEFAHRNQFYYDEDDDLPKRICSDLNAPVLDFKNFTVEGDRIAFVMKQTHSLKELLNQNKKGKDPRSIDIQKLIGDVYTSIEYANSRFGVSNIELQPESICAIERFQNETGESVLEYYITNWLSGAQVEQSDANLFRPSGMQKIQRFIEGRNDNLQTKYAAPESNLPLKQNTAAEIYALGLTSLDVLGMEPDTWKPLPQMEVPEMYDTILSEIIRCLTMELSKKEQCKSILSEIKEIMAKISAMLKKDPVTRIKEFVGLLSSKHIGKGLKAQKVDLKKFEEQQNGNFVEEEEKKIGEVQVAKLLARKEVGKATKAIEGKANPQELPVNPELRALLERPDTANIKKISIEKNLKPRLRDKGATIIGSITTWKNLKILSLENNRINDTGAEAIGRNATWINLEVLSLHENLIGDQGAVVIGSNTIWTKLEKLYLHQNKIGDIGAVMIGSNPAWTNLKKLGLHANNIGDEGAESIGRSTAWSNLEELSLYQNKFGDKSALVIGSNTTWTKLKKLLLSMNQIGDEGSESIGKNTAWIDLEMLSIYENQLGDTGTVVIGRNISWKNLKRLVLYSNKIGDEGCEAIGSNSTWVNLEELHLNQNQIGDKGAVALANNTSWKNLRRLVLYLNKIGDQGSEAIGKSTIWINLEILYLHQNQIGDKGAAAIGDNKVWKNLKKLRLDTNKIGDEGCEAIGWNCTWVELEQLCLGQNQIGDLGGVGIGKNSSWVNLQELQLNQNQIGDTGAMMIGGNTIWKNLQTFSLAQNKIQDRGALALASNKTWKKVNLDVSGNPMTEKGKKALKSNPNFGRYVTVPSSDCVIF